MKVQNQTGFTQMAQQKKQTFSMAITSKTYQDMIQKTLNDSDKAARLTASLIALVSRNEKLKECDVGSVIGSALAGVSLNLSLELGEYSVVPYGNVAQFQIQYKGLGQLAIRTGYYSKIKLFEVLEGEFKGYNSDGDPIISKISDPDEREKRHIVGYYAYFRLLNGFEDNLYMTYKEILNHADRYSPAFSLEKYNAFISGEMDAKERSKLLNGSPWYGDEKSAGHMKMCKKTVFKQLFGGPLAPKSAEFSRALDMDEAVIPADMPASQAEQAIPVTDFSVNEENHGQAEETATEPPTSTAVSENVPSGGKDTNPTKKSVERKETANAAVESAEDFTNGFFGEGE